MAKAKKRSTAKALTSRQEVRAHRVRDTPAFAKAARRQSKRVAGSQYAAADQAFVDAISIA